MANSDSLILKKKFSFSTFFDLSYLPPKPDFPLPNHQITETIAEGRSYARRELDRLASELGETVDENLIFVYAHSPLRDAYDHFLKRQRASFHAEMTPFSSLLVLFTIFFAFFVIGVFGYIYNVNEKMVLTTFLLACLPLIVVYFMDRSVKKANAKLKRAYEEGGLTGYFLTDFRDISAKMVCLADNHLIVGYDHQNTGIPRAVPYDMIGEINITRPMDTYRQIDIFTKTGERVFTITRPAQLKNDFVSQADLFIELLQKKCPHIQ